MMRRLRERYADWTYVEVWYWDRTEIDCYGTYGLTARLRCAWNVLVGRCDVYDETGGPE